MKMVMSKETGKMASKTTKNDDVESDERNNGKSVKTN